MKLHIRAFVLLRAVKTSSQSWQTYQRTEEQEYPGPQEEIRSSDLDNIQCECKDGNGDPEEQQAHDQTD